MNKFYPSLQLLTATYIYMHTNNIFSIQHGDGSISWVDTGSNNSPPPKTYPKIPL